MLLKTTISLCLLFCVSLCAMQNDEDQIKKQQAVSKGVIACGNIIVEMKRAADSACDADEAVKACKPLARSLWMANIKLETVYALLREGQQNKKDDSIIEMIKTNEEIYKKLQKS